MRRLILGMAAIALLAPVTVSAHQTATTPHVLLIILENKGYQKTLGSCSADPYFCGLAKSYTSLIGWKGVGHPSLPNYLAITSGSTQGCTGDSCPEGKYHGDLMAQFIKAGIPFAFDMESMPKPCDTSDSGNYVHHHNPGPYYTDDNCSSTNLPYPGAGGLLTQLGKDGFVWVTPNIKDDMHSGSVQAGDKWLQANLNGIISSSWFTSGGTVIVTMDEGDNPASANSIPMVVISSNAAGNGNVAMAGNHYDTLGSLETAFGLPLLGSAKNLPGLTALFG